MEEFVIVKKVTSSNKYWDISSESGTCFGLKKKYKVKPKVGDEITLHTKNFSLIRGMDLNGEIIFYKTDAQLEVHRIKEQLKYKKQKEEQFKKEEKGLNESYDKLPKIFQERIDRFRKNNPDFRIDYESYEMFCCKQAIEIANGCKTKEKVQEFSKLNWNDQKKMVKKLDDGHSGNTFSASVQLAYLYLNNEEDVKKMHGSLSTLVGSKEYGDIEKNENNK